MEVAPPDPYRLRLLTTGVESVDAFLSTVLLGPLEELAPRRAVVLGIVAPTTLRALLAVTRTAGTEVHYVTSGHVRFETARWSSSDATRLHVHTSPSRTLLEGLAPYDVALIDVEPNWWTVGRAIRAVVDAAGDDPLVLVANAGWPHGHRDAYADPRGLPQEAVHEHRRGGLRPGHPDVDESGGFDAARAHARTVGGPRNGVVAAIRDALQPHRDRYRAAIVPGFNGLGLLWPLRYRDEHPRAADALDALAEPGPVRGLLERLETARLHAEIGRLDLGAITVEGPLPETVDVARRSPAELRELASALVERSRGDAAVRLLLEGCRRHPDDVELHAALGRTAMRLNRPTAALPALRRAAELRPGDRRILLELGQAASRAQGNEDEAERTIRQAVDLDPGDATAQVLLASHLRLLGRFTEAAERCQHVLARDPGNLAALAVLGHLDQLDAEQLARAHELSHDTALSTHDTANVHFALAKAFDRVGEHGTAFEHARRANELHKVLFRTAHGAAYDPVAHRELVDATIATFTRQRIERLASLADATTGAVVIGGLPRSGTTLTEQILASHPAVFGGGELGLVGTTVQAIGREAGGPARYPGATADLTPARAAELGARLAERFAAQDPEAARVTDKMPQNFLYHGLVAAVLPGARQYTLRRDPRDVFVSSYFQGFTSPALTYSCDQTWFAFYAREHERLTAHWIDVLPELLVVDYAELARDQERVSRRLVAHAGLEWDPACLSFHRTQRPIHTASATQVRQPMYTSSVERWRRYEPWLDELLTGLAEGTEFEASLTAGGTPAALPATGPVELADGPPTAG